MVNDEERKAIAQQMIKSGGEFIQNLGRALLYADERNTNRIKNAFPDYWTLFRKRAMK